MKIIVTICLAIFCLAANGQTNEASRKQSAVSRQPAVVTTNVVSKPKPMVAAPWFQQLYVATNRIAELKKEQRRYDDELMEFKRMAELKVSAGKITFKQSLRQTEALIASRAARNAAINKEIAQRILDEANIRKAYKLTEK